MRLLRFYGPTDFVSFFLKYAHGYYVLNGRICITCLWFAYSSRVTSPLTRMFPFPFHVSPYFTVMDCRLVYAYRSVLRLPFTTRRLVCRVVIPRLMTLLPLTTVCTCIYQPGIYTVGDEDSFLIFNLLCNHPTSATCEIPHMLRAYRSTRVGWTSLPVSK